MTPNDGYIDYQLLTEWFALAMRKDVDYLDALFMWLTGMSVHRRAELAEGFLPSYTKCAENPVTWLMSKFDRAVELRQFDPLPKDFDNLNTPEYGMDRDHWDMLRGLARHEEANKGFFYRIHQTLGHYERRIASLSEEKRAWKKVSDTLHADTVFFDWVCHVTGQPKTLAAIRETLSDMDADTRIKMAHSFGEALAEPDEDKRLELMIGAMNADNWKIDPAKKPDESLRTDCPAASEAMEEYKQSLDDLGKDEPTPPNYPECPCERIEQAHKATMACLHHAQIGYIEASKALMQGRTEATFREASQCLDVLSIVERQLWNR